MILDFYMHVCKTFTVIFLILNRTVLCLKIIVEIVIRNLCVWEHFLLWYSHTNRHRLLMTWTAHIQKILASLSGCNYFIHGSSDTCSIAKVLSSRAISFSVLWHYRQVNLFQDSERIVYLKWLNSVYRYQSFGWLKLDLIIFGCSSYHFPPPPFLFKW